jgi:hypothetical protein
VVAITLSCDGLHQPPTLTEILYAIGAHIFLARSLLGNRSSPHRDELVSGPRQWQAGLAALGVHPLSEGTELIGILTWQLPLPARILALTRRL